MPDDLKIIPERIRALRIDYAGQELSEKTVAQDPFVQFRAWFDEAVRVVEKEPNAMTLATVSADAKPSARVVLMKDFSARGISFFTNYRSTKAEDLASNTNAALLFYWPEVARQIRLEGKVAKLPRVESETYFATRPRAAQLGAHASIQSSIIPSRLSLEEKLAQISKTYQDQDVPCPEHWGGYLFAPELFEFWQGRESRLHDRIRYSKNGSTWTINRLSP